MDLYLAGYHADTQIGDKLINWWNRSIYSHVELMHSPLQPVLVGVNATSMRSMVKTNGVITTMRYYALSDWHFLKLNLSEEVSSRAVDWFKKHEGSPYDYLGLLGFVYGPQRDDRTKYFCSEAVAAALGFQEAWRFSPQLIWNVLLNSPGTTQGL